MSSTTGQSRKISASDELFDALRLYSRNLGSHANSLPESDLEFSLLQLQKLATLGQLASEIAHDFGNLMTIMLGYSELMMAAVEDGQRPDCEHLAELRRAAERASTMTTRLLGYCRKSPDEPILLDLSLTVSGLATMLGRLLGSSARLHLSADPSAGNIAADTKQIEQLVTNLVLNARDAITIGGQIEIDVARVHLESPLVHALGISPAGDYVRLRVRDLGCGMNSEAIAQLFRPFYTTKKSGTGLGLAIVARIARHCDAAITIETAPGAGTTFDVYFPRVPDAAN